MEAVESYEHEGVPIQIYQDDSPGDTPRDWSNVGTMVCWHRRYDLGDRQPEDAEKRALERGGFPLLERYLGIFHGATTVIKLGLLDHSGISMYAGGGDHWCDPGGWDSGTVGFIFDTTEGRDECGTTIEFVDAVLRQEIAVYDQYLRGDVYGYVVADGTEDEESCWGFYGMEDVESEAKAIAESVVSERAEKRALPWLPTFGNEIQVSV